MRAFLTVIIAGLFSITAAQASPNTQQEITAVAMGVSVYSSNVEVKPKKQKVVYKKVATKKYKQNRQTLRQAARSEESDVSVRRTYSSDPLNGGKYAAGARPGKWCGWWVRTLFGGGPEYNVARAWAKRGTATTAGVGAVVVWPHHVGIITGKSSNGQWIVKSGNDGGRVRERPRSVAKAIAFRIVS